MLRLLITLAIVAAPVVYGYSAGAPSGACSDGIPQHHVDPQKGPAPYTIKVSKNNLKSGETVEITIAGKTPADTIKGLLVVAKVGNTPVGKFDVSPSDKSIQLLDCGNGKNNAVTHKKMEKGVESVTFGWTAPKGLSEKVVFVVTVALHGGKFWVGEKSSVINVN